MAGVSPSLFITRFLGDSNRGASSFNCCLNLLSMSAQEENEKLEIDNSATRRNAIPISRD